MTDHDHLPLTAEENEEVWTKVFDRIHRKRRRRNIAYGAITVLFIFSCLIGYRTYITPNIYLADKGTMEVELKDGTSITLLKDAKLTIEKSFPDDTREVALEGNAIFHVAKSKEHPFIVHGNGYDTRVMGTVFKVLQNGRTFKVDLYEGSVSVTRKDHHEAYILKPKQQFTNFGNPAIAAVDATDKGADRKELPTPTLAFTQCRVKDAIRVLQTTYGITVEYPAKVENQEITIKLPQADAGLWMETLALQLGLTIKQHNENIYRLEK
ncbi:FecR family protein [Pedobacter sp. KLB.chiD]|uniref:FecR family protein n=1 Tax=Pedobacter sp. KLB.chiD TaxID=3387402 RepID=UPI00399B01D3